MARISVDIRSKLNFDAVAKDLRAETQRAVREAADVIAADIRSRAPVRDAANPIHGQQAHAPGHLRDSVRVDAALPSSVSPAPSGRGSQLRGTGGRFVSAFDVEELYVVVDDPAATTIEYGGVMTIPVSTQMRKFFWGRFYETGDDRWRRMAISKKDTFTLTVDAHPFVNPAFHGNRDALERAERAAIKRVA